MDDIDNFSLTRRFRFAVIDLDKSRDYPANFVCILPSIMSVEKKSSNIYQKIFGNEGLEQAKALLTAAMKTESESSIKAEIERRLKLLEPKDSNQIKCSSCRNLFLARRVRRFKQNLCPDCLKKKYGNRE
jgi:formylmethanofuran dehydrogenase subunit E